ncbi:ubiquinone anaerobic biosynthesis accessory factor UbiT [Shewanella dokdonensis]|uniref:Ubiquinone biosynthesis accessory factor UbiT n=1 Tax=Shewanella dokdonensis TaxID=712036 RepID=A0ABX8DD72_9GAMM|nr:SCP2 sterol-binding domain-containing protein [Shewanella dokdonensis]MCL1073603.1 SCP2 sterol-binding domain-containing protein [Shewanella dokdonensis]QVK22646.1 SCP2 sterol-binding domain-containing protein [Shewanella dokdonensis]
MRGELLSQMAKDLLNMAPKIASKPLGIVPFVVKAKVLQQLLQHLLAEQINDGELDFLVENWVAVEVPDLQLSFEVSFNEHFTVRPVTSPKVTFSANSSDLLLVVAGKEDPDTLFFQRRLCIEGDTELGLEVKNLLLAIDLQRLPVAVRTLLDKLAKSLLWLQTTSGADVQLS